jgi:hypothetical protein
MLLCAGKLTLPRPLKGRGEGQESHLLTLPLESRSGIPTGQACCKASWEEPKYGLQATPLMLYGEHGLGVIVTLSVPGAWPGVQMETPEHTP